MREQHTNVMHMMACVGVSLARGSGVPECGQEFPIWQARFESVSRPTAALELEGIGRCPYLPGHEYRLEFGTWPDGM